jgi:hypothetical protein
MTRTAEKRAVRIPPMAIGALGGLVLVGLIFVMDIWFPALGEGFDRHKRLVQGVYFTIGFFAFLGERVWRWRHRGAFWQSISAFCLVHVLGIYVYSVWVHPLLVWQWMILFLPEAYIFVSFVNWSTRRFGHSDKPKVSF